MNKGHSSPRRGQSIVEYIIIIGIAIVALYALGPGFRRGVQSVVKATADQLAPQQNADQDFSADSSHLDISNTKTGTTVNRSKQELMYTTNTESAESTATATNTVTNTGFLQQ